MLTLVGYTQNACNPPGYPSTYQLNQKEGTLFSPYFPANYKHNLRCYYFIGAPDTQQIRITFNTIRLERYKDWIDVGLGDTVWQDIQLTYDYDTKYSIPLQNRMVLFQAEKLWIYLSTDFSVLGQGFNISYALGE